jgi:hypothetical protein
MHTNTHVHATVYEWEEEKLPTQITLKRHEQPGCSRLEMEVRRGEEKSRFTVFVNKDAYLDFPTYDSNSTSEGNENG